MVANRLPGTCTAQHSTRRCIGFQQPPPCTRKCTKDYCAAGLKTAPFQAPLIAAHQIELHDCTTPHRVPIQLLKTHDSCCPYQSLLTQPLWLDPLDHPLSMLAPVRLPCRGDFDHMPFLLALSDHQPCCITHSMIRHRRIHPRSNWVNNTSC